MSTSGPAVPGRRPGLVLLLALLCLLALEVTAVGVHFIAVQELRSARAVARNLELRLAAQSAAVRVLRAWPPVGLATLGPLQEITVATAGGDAPHGIRHGATVQRLDSGLYLIRATATSPLRETAAAGVLVALMQTDQVLAAAAAAVTSNSTVRVGPASAISAGNGEPDTACPPPPVQSGAILVSGEESLQVDGGSVEGGVMIAPDGSAVAVNRLGPLSVAHLAQAARTIAADRLAPAPSAEGDICDTGHPLNWGEPADSIPVCVSWQPILHRVGNLTIDGGRGQGILVVDGDLVLSGARFDGLIFVRGTALLRAGARVNGALIVDGAVDIEHGSVAMSRCALTETMSHVRLRIPYHPAGRMWIPLF